MRRPAGFIAPCLPSKVTTPPSGLLWVHEIKHDGYRLMVRRDGPKVRCFTRGGHNWTDRFPAIVEAALRIKASSFLIDGETVIERDDGTPDFRALRSRLAAKEAVLYAFDLLMQDGEDIRIMPTLWRKRQLKTLLGRAKRRAIRYVEHLDDDGPVVFDHVCRMGWRASSASGSMRRTGAGHRRRGSRSRTRRTMRCGARRIDAEPIRRSLPLR
jgi:ATP-dependent DNA ligase